MASNVTSTSFNLILLFVFSLPIIAIAHNAIAVLSSFALCGHDKIFTIVTHIINQGFLYTILTISIMLCSWFYISQCHKQQFLDKHWKDDLRYWQNRASKIKAENGILFGSYNVLKKNISEAVAPCGQVIFNADDTISLQHLFCKDYVKQEKRISDLTKETIRQRKLIAKLRSKAPIIIPTPEYIESLKCQAIHERDARLEHLAAEAACRNDEIKDLKSSLEESREMNEALKKIEKRFMSKVSRLLATNKVLKASQVSEAQVTIERLENALSQSNAEFAGSAKEFDDLMEQYEDLLKERNNFQSQNHTAMESNSALARQVSEMKKALQDKTSEVEVVKKSAKSKIESAQIANDAMLTRLRDENTTLKAPQHTTLAAPTPIVNDSSPIADNLAKEKAAKAELEAALNKVRLQHSQEIEAKNAEIDALKARITTSADFRGSAEYRDLCAEAQRIQQERDQLSTEVTQLNSTLKQYPSLEAIKKAENECNQLKESFDHYISDVSSQIKVKDLLIGTKDYTIGRQNATIAEKDQLIKDKDQLIENKDTIIRNMFQRKLVQSAATDATPLLNNPTADIEILKGVIAGKDARIAILEKRTKNAENGERAAREEVVLAKASSERADAIRDDFEHLTIATRQLEVWLDSKNIGSSDQPLLSRIQQSHDILNTMAFAAHGIPELLNKKRVVLLDPETNQPFRSLKSRVELLADDFVRLYIAAEKNKNAATAINPSNQSPYTNSTPVDIVDHFSTVSEDEKTRLLNEINHNLDVCKITNDTFSLLERTTFAIVNAKDAFDVLQFLHNENLFSKDHPPTLIDQVTFLAEEHNRHRNGGDLFYNLYHEIEAQLNMRFGSRKKGNHMDTALSRVKKLMELPHNRKGAIRDDY